jgi:site-specific DNA-methyltransferase (cytosine-N4-specific)
MSPTTYEFHLQTEYHLREFERVLALHEILSCLRLGQVPRSTRVHVSLKLRDTVSAYASEPLPFPLDVSLGGDGHSNVVTCTTRNPLSEDVLKRLTFVQRVEWTRNGERGVIVPFQVYLNRLPKMMRNGLPLLADIESVRCNKREHGYLTHGFHSYKGKYYPQLVASLFNWCGVEPDDWVLDPFCGSGTTLVEATLRGIRSVGVDLNPLAALIADVKTSALLAPYEELDSYCQQMLKEVKEAIEYQRQSKDTLTDQFLTENAAHLREWFPPKALAQINTALRAIRRCEYPPARGIGLLTLSDNLREISYQDPESLRILRRKTDPPEPMLVERLTRGVQKRLASLEVLRHAAPYLPERFARARALTGDTRRLNDMLKRAHLRMVRFRAAITSPPYATALPYIDTDRLSLFALGLLRKDERASLEWGMIGNREIADAQRRALEAQLLSPNHGLPESVISHIREIHRRNATADVGFRRRNVAALLYKYFADMQATFVQVKDVLEQGSRFVVVIGNSSTVAGDESYEIRTDEWLAEIAVAQGFEHYDSIPMTDQAGYMRHSKNMIKAETITVLEKPAP